MADQTRFPNPPFVTVGAAGVVAAAPPAATTVGTLPKNLAGVSSNYALIVQVPLPVISVQGALAAAFSLPDIIPPVIPDALLWLVKNAEALFKDVVAVAALLIKTIPETTISILVKVGPATVVNIQLVAKKVPVDVPIPSFILSLANLAIDPNVALALPISTAPAVVIEVPVPVPIGSLPKTGVSGGQFSASASAKVQPVPVNDPIRLPIF